MYQGYRIKINNIKIENSMIARGTFSLTQNDRIIDSWTDADQIDHEVIANKKKASISFELREHTTSEHGLFKELLAKTENVPVEYYDDNDDTYKIGSFKIKNPTFTHKNATRKEIIYENTPINLEEY